MGLSGQDGAAGETPRERDPASGAEASPAAASTPSKRRSRSAAPPPPAVSAMAGLAEIIDLPAPEVPLDELDLALLRRLAADSRLSQRALSREIPLSPPAIGERLARMERLGLIRGYTIDLDRAALGYPMTVFLAMTTGPGADLPGIIGALRERPELEEVTIVTGQWDLLAHFRLRDHAHLQEVLLSRIWQIGGIQRVETFLGLGGYAGAGLLPPEQPAPE